jgi:hypothetical protein
MDLYHVTPVENKDTIMQEGLKVNAPNPTPWDAQTGGKFGRSAVHFAVGVDEARKWAQQIGGAYADREEVAGTDPHFHWGDSADKEMSLFRLEKPENVPLTRHVDKNTGLTEAHTAQDVPPHLLTHVEDFYPYSKEGD